MICLLWISIVTGLSFTIYHPRLMTLGVALESVVGTPLELYCFVYTHFSDRYIHV